MLKISAVYIMRNLSISARILQSRVKVAWSFLKTKNEHYSQKDSDDSWHLLWLGLILIHRWRNSITELPLRKNNIETTKNTPNKVLLKYDNRYTGQIYLELDTDQDLKDAQYLSQQYPELDYWRKCINDKDLRGFVTGKSFSEALILASTNPQYDKRLFIDLPG